MQLAVSDVADSQESVGAREPEALAVQDFARIVDEIQLQPNWRREADKCCAYYESNQISAADLAELERRGMAPVVINHIQGAVNSMLGMEAKFKRDWRVTADDERWQDVAEAESAKMAQYERETRADRACSDAYASMVKAGLGWTEVTRSSDAFRFPVRVTSPHRREMFWQWTAREPDLSDSLYVIRRRWFPEDTLIAFFPDHAATIRATASGWPAFWLERFTQDDDLARDFEQERFWSLPEYEWRDTYKRMLCVFETWTRRYTRGYVLKLPGQRIVEFDKTNPVHLEAARRGITRPELAVYNKLTQTLWIGPHKVGEYSPQSNRLPYVPWWAYREDGSNAPYGVIRSMLSPQDEINARRSKLLWLLNAKRTQVDSDALDSNFQTIQDLTEEAGRADATFVMNPSRRNANALSVTSDLALAAQQFQTLMADERAFHTASGIYAPQMGAQEGKQSGIAIQSLVDQGAVMAAELNDNAMYARRATSELLLEKVREDIGGQPVEVVVGESAKKRTISLNRRVADEFGRDIVENSTEHAEVKVGLEDVPSTAAYRQQQMVGMAEIIKSLPPEAQAVMAPYYLDGSDLPKRKQMAKDVRRVLGLPEMSEDEEDQARQAQAQQAAKVEEIQTKAAVAEITLKEAQAAKTMAEAQRLATPEAGVPPEVQAQMESAAAEAQQQVEALAKELVQARAEAERLKADADKRVKALEEQIAAEKARSAEAQERRDDDIIRAEIEKSTAIEVAKIEAKVREAEAGVKAAAAAKPDSVKPEPVDLKPVLDAVKSIEAVVKDVAARVEKVEKAEAAEPAEPVQIHVHTTGEVTKTLKIGDIKRDKDGKLAGASAEIKEKPAK